MKRKIIFAFVISMLAVVNAHAQDDDDERKTGLRKENLFTGGTFALGFGSGTTSFGLGPYFGYSVNKYVDVAVSVDYNYISQRDYNSPTKYRQSIISPGAFVRIYPVKFLFAHAQIEHNFIQYKEKYNVPGLTDAVYRYNVSSFLVGPGYASGREPGEIFYYISILFDVAQHPGSPYLDNQGRTSPIVRAGFNIPLFQGRREGRMKKSGNNDNN